MSVVVGVVVVADVVVGYQTSAAGGRLMAVTVVVRGVRARALPAAPTEPARVRHAELSALE